MLKIGKKKKKKISQILSEKLFKHFLKNPRKFNFLRKPNTMHISMIFLVLLFISFCIQRIIDEVFEPSSLTLELLLDSSFRKNPNIKRLSLSDSLKLRYLEHIGINFDQIQEKIANNSFDGPQEKLMKSSIMMSSKHYIHLNDETEDYFYLFNVYDYKRSMRHPMIWHNMYTCNL